MPSRRVLALALLNAAACLLIFPALSQSPAASHAAADLGKSLLSAGLDPAQCYRIRDLIITREDARFYLTDGYLIFGKPVDGAPVSAVFIADTEGDDGELLMLPSDRSERRSLAANSGAPTLDEHFTSALFVFTGTEDRALLNQVRQHPGVRNVPDIGAIMAERWTPRLSAAVAGLESRLVLDLVSEPQARGFFQAFILGRKLGSFDLAYEPRSSEQLSTGQIATRDGNAWWNTWTSFTSRSHRGAPPPEPEMRILSYRIEATLDASLNLRCVTRVRVQIRNASRTAIPFDLSRQMRATAAKIDGEPAEVYQRDNQTLSAPGGIVNGSGDELVIVVPAHALTAGSEHEIEIHHEGHVISSRGNGVYFVGARGVWYPNRGAQFATYDVTYRYPKTLDLISAGPVREDGVEGDQRVTRSVPSGPIRLLAFNLGKYDRKQIERGGYTIEVLANREIEDALRPRQSDQPVIQSAPFPRPGGRGRGSQNLDASAIPMTMPEPGPVNQLEHVAQDVADAMDFYRARFGPPPLNRLEVSPVPGRFGQGFAGMLYLSTLSYLPVTARPLSLMTPYEQAFYSELLRAHETAHQWWGNIVTTGSYHHEWLLEALANYSALLFLESHKGPKFTDGILDAYRAQLLAKGPDGDETEAEGPLVQGRRLESSNNPNAWTAVAYGKGTWVLHMLRRRMGDAQFTKMLAELRRRYEFKDITTGDFRALCAAFLPPKSADPKLEDFFDVWVYGTGIPGIKMNYSVKGKLGALELTATVTQSDVPDDFSVVIPVEIQTGRGKVVREIRTSSDPVTITVPVTLQTAKAVLDPAISVLRR